MKLKLVDWKHIKGICENVIKDGKSAQDLYLTLIFAVEKVGNVISYEVEHNEKEGYNG